MTSGPGLETLKVRAGALTTLTFEKVPDILILKNKGAIYQHLRQNAMTYFIMGWGLVTPPLPPWPSYREGM